MILLTLLLLQDPEPRIEILRFDGGAEIRGVVLRETAESLFVDIGYTVIDVPKRVVLEREVVEEEAAGTEQARSIYFTADLPRAPIQDLVNRFGPGVVRVSTPAGLGSGFIINEQEGYVVTNHHVVAGERRITVTLFLRDGDQIRLVPKENCEIIALSESFDLALLRIADFEPGELSRVYIGDPQELENGDRVFAIGSPLGLTRTVSEGIVSNRAREMSGHLFIQTTTEINPGNSGGPLFNDRGEVIGVTSMKLVMSGVEGMGFAIPAHYVTDFLENREAFAFDRTNPNSGVRYNDPPRRAERTDP